MKCSSANIHQLPLPVQTSVKVVVTIAGAEAVQREADFLPSSLNSDTCNWKAVIGPL
jgi:hypothetical protein